MTHINNPNKCAEIIKKRTDNFTPKIGIILGSGLNNIAGEISNPVVLPYSDLPGFSQSTVEGHSGQLIIGDLNSTPVACYQGRVHYFEDTSAATFKTMIRTLKLLGCDTVILTNAAGSLHHGMLPGSLMAIEDHINFTGFSPLKGPNDDEFGPRFPPMEDVYNANLREQLHQTAQQLAIPLHSGVYIGVMGPMFETPAEINAYRILGADAVGMSTIPEVIIARHCGLKITAISAITNLAAGMTEQKLSHDVTLAGGKMAIESLKKLLLHFLERIHHGN